MQEHYRKYFFAWEIKNDIKIRSPWNNDLNVNFGKMMSSSKLHFYNENVYTAPFEEKYIVIID